MLNDVAMTVRSRAAKIFFKEFRQLQKPKKYVKKVIETNKILPQYTKIFNHKETTKSFFRHRTYAIPT